MVCQPTKVNSFIWGLSIGFGRLMPIWIWRSKTRQHQLLCAHQLSTNTRNKSKVQLYHLNADNLIKFVEFLNHQLSQSIYAANRKITWLERCKCYHLNYVYTKIISQTLTICFEWTNLLGSLTWQAKLNRSPMRTHQRK